MPEQVSLSPMEPTDGRRDGLTRRDAIRGGGGLVAGGLLSGCAGAGGAGGDGGTAESSGETTASDAAAGAETAEGETAGGDGSYSVTMAPSGEVTFDAPPETWMAYFTRTATWVSRWGRRTGCRR